MKLLVSCLEASANLHFEQVLEYLPECELKGIFDEKLGDFSRLRPANRQKAQQLLHFVHDKSYKCRTDLVFLQVKSTRTDGETGKVSPVCHEKTSSERVILPNA